MAGLNMLLQCKYAVLEEDRNLIPLIKRVFIKVVSFLSFSRYTYKLLQTNNFNVAVIAGKNALLSTE